MKQQVNQHRSKHNFQVSDMVFFFCNLTSNPPCNSKGIISWLQISIGHIRFFSIFGLLLINRNFLLLLMSTRYFMSLVLRKLLAPTSKHKLFSRNWIMKYPSFWSWRPSSIDALVSFSLDPSQRY